MLMKLLLVFAEVGLFSFGGGYAALPLIQSLVVEKMGWLTMAEYADLTTIAQMTPGPIFLNSATFTGLKMAGFIGSIVCSFGAILPSLIIVLILSWIYTKYRSLPAVKTVLTTLRPAVVAMIAKAGVTFLLLAVFGSMDLMEISNIRWVEVVVFIGCFYMLRKYKTDPVKIIFGSAVVGTVLYLVF